MGLERAFHGFACCDEKGASFAESADEGPEGDVVRYAACSPNWYRQGERQCG